MGTPGKPQNVQYFCGVIFDISYPLDRVVTELENRFGKIDFQSDIFPFDKISYYENEMGVNLNKVFLAFKDLWPPDKIVDMKLETNAMEQAAMRQGPGGRMCRQINLDPGYVELPKMVLASTKNAGNRIYMSRGIYVESTLMYTHKTFHAWPWTYKDYQTEEYIAFFNKLRARYAEKLRGE